MKYIVTHTSPDMDAITSTWLIKKFLPGWEDAEVKFVPAGERIGELPKGQSFDYAIEKQGENEYLQVDTGMGPLDHHQTISTKVCGTSLTFDFVKENTNEIDQDKLEALQRVVDYVVEVDHFQEIFRPDSLANYYDFSIVNILSGLKMEKPNSDLYYVEFIFDCLDAVLHDMENRIWAEKEIKTNGIEFQTKWGKGLGLDSINDSVIKLAQLMGYVVVIRRDPRKGYVRIKARPDGPVDSSRFMANGRSKDKSMSNQSLTINPKGIDLTLTCEKLSKMDPQATWFLHVSKKMLLNGTPKNPKMKPTKLKLNDIIEVLKTI